MSGTRANGTPITITIRNAGTAAAMTMIATETTTETATMTTTMTTATAIGSRGAPHDSPSCCRRGNK